MCLGSDRLSSDPQPSPAGQPVGSLNRWIARSTLLRPQFLGIAAGVFYFTTSSQWTISSILVQLPLTVLFIDRLFRMSAGILRALGHLPISRRAITAWILLPPAALVLAGTFAGHLLGGSWATWKFRREISLVIAPPGEASWPVSAGPGATCHDSLLADPNPGVPRR